MVSLVLLRLPFSQNLSLFHNNQFMGIIYSVAQDEKGEDVLQPSLLGITPWS
jgi:hypothetical protein